MRRLTIMLAAIAALMLVPAANAFAAEELHVTVVGSGAGEVTSGTFGEFEGEPALACSYVSPGPATGVCDNEFVNKGGTEEETFAGFGGYDIWLNAIPASGSEFIRWEQIGNVYEGCDEGSSTSPFCSLYVLIGEGESASVTPCFVLEGEGAAGCAPTPEPNVKLNIEEGEGTVVSNPAGLSCSGAAITSCEAALAEGPVTLTASPAPGYAFKSWKKCDTGGVNGRQCTITANSSLKEVGAKFVKTWNLTTKKAGSGIGKYQTSPGGVLCLYNCGSAKAAFKEGSVIIKEAPAKHNHFVKWLGDCSGSSPECTLNMNEDHSVEAEFAPDTQFTLSISKTGGGTASIKSSPSGLLCGYTCGSQSASFYSGETVSIAVTLNKGTTALEWTTSAGTCTGNALTCTVPMSSAKTLVAKLS